MASPLDDTGPGGTEAPPAACEAPTPAEWRAAMGFFPSGVTIVSTWENGEPVGSTVNAFCSVSLSPPMLLVCIDLANPIRAALESAGIFGVNILDHDCRHVARRFATDPLTGRFEAFPYRAAAGGAPQLDLAPVFVDCAVEHIHAAGDHLIVVGRGVRIEHTPTATPLLYHKGQYPRLGAPD
jgi:3-hydroxy-9,10-secoandrosta-1,3,5(10)-triene-9,17-dione monooxygenase reductase component